MVKKNFGQNFLTDQHVLDKIVLSADITDEDVIIEIGPGIGTLTQALCKNAHKVIAVEIDKTLIPILEETLVDYHNLQIINEDILKFDFYKIFEQYAGKRFKVVANLPYYITTPIIMGLLERKMPLHNITVMVQKEVGYRMKAMPGSKDYGALSLAIQYYAVPYLVANVPENCFMPRPNVDSAVIQLTLHPAPPVSVSDEAVMFKIIKCAFAQRRKTLVNCLFNTGDFGWSKEQWAQFLKSIGFDERVRGESLTLAQFATITQHFLDVWM